MWQLERLAPAQKRGERIDVGAEQPGLLRVGRSEDCEVRLFSPTASRVHAELHREADGSWWLVPQEGCLVLADGERVADRCELCEGLSLELGRDRMRCQTPAAVTEGPPPRALWRPAPGWHGPLFGLAAVFVLVLVFLRACG